jgi:hypothetical protein
MVVVRKVRFESIPLSDIPAKVPIVKLSARRRGSRWDAALLTLESTGSTNGIRVSPPSWQERDRMKSAIQTLAKSRGLFVNVLNDSARRDFFAWINADTSRVQI